MLSVTLWRENDERSGVSMVYVGDAVVQEFNYQGVPTSHYFKTKSEAVDFIIRSAYGLLSAGYKVFEDER